MYKYLPSKKFSLTLLSIIIAIGIIYGFSWLANNQKITSLKNQNTEVQTKVQEFMALDTDGDGMKDWEEALWKTDPKKADTDGDGTSDSEEIKLNRDPLKPNTAKAVEEPDDKISEAIIADNKKVVDDFAKLSETDKMGRMMFSQYLATKKVGQDLTQTDINNIVQNTIAEMPSVSFKQYSKENLSISSTTTQETLKKYGNDVSVIILNDLFGEKIIEQNYDFYGMTEVQNIIQTVQNDPSETEITQAFSELDPIINKYRVLISDLLKVNVPNSFADNHLLLINSFESMRDNLSQVKNAANDIVLLPQLLISYSDNIDNLWNSLVLVGNKFKENNIAFAPNDFGGQFFNDIINK